MAVQVEGIRRSLVPGLVLIAGTAIEQAPPSSRHRHRAGTFHDLLYQEALEIEINLVDTTRRLSKYNNNNNVFI